MKGPSGLLMEDSPGDQASDGAESAAVATGLKESQLQLEGWRCHEPINQQARLLDHCFVLFSAKQKHSHSYPALGSQENWPCATVRYQTFLCTKFGSKTCRDTAAPCMYYPSVFQSPLLVFKFKKGCLWLFSSHGDHRIVSPCRERLPGEILLLIHGLEEGGLELSCEKHVCGWYLVNIKTTRKWTGKVNPILESRQFRP